MAKIDYDVGDLVACVEPSLQRPGVLQYGAVYTVTRIVRPGDSLPGGGRANDLGAWLAEAPHNPNTCGWCVFKFRKLPKKSQEFFAGETQTVRDLVPAE